MECITLTDKLLIIGMMSMFFLHQPIGDFFLWVFSKRNRKHNCYDCNEEIKESGFCDECAEYYKEN